MKRLYSFISSLLIGCLWAVLLGVLSDSLTAQEITTARHSLLREGKWVKIAIDKTGIYRLTYDELRKMGFAEPEKVGVYGYGGALISERLSQAPPHDLPQVPLRRVQEAIYFYGQGVTNWYYDTAASAYRHVTNHYSLRGYLFLSDTPTPGPLVAPDALLPAEGAPSKVASYDALFLYEKDLYSLRLTGRILFGEPFLRGEARRIPIDLGGGARSNPQIKLNYAYTALPTEKSSGKLSLSIGGNTIAEDPIERSEDLSLKSYLAGIYHFRSGVTAEVVNNRFDLDMAYLPSGDPAYLDFVEVQSSRDLHYHAGEQMILRRAEPNNKSLLFSISGLGSEGLIFAIDKRGASHVSATVVGDAHTFTSNALDALGQPATFIALKPSDAYTPTFVGEVAAQNIQGEEVPDLLIVSTNDFYPEAQRLATYHREHDAMKVLVATQEQIFNEFSSGTPDASAYRLCLKYFYDRWRVEHQGEDYCPIQFLLFGDGAADNRKLSPEWTQGGLDNVEFLLTYQSVNSLNLYSYTSDDYFGKLQEEEDNLTVGAKTLSVGVGRFPVRTLREARAAVNKTIAYSENRDPGVWKTRACFVADNADDNGSYSHLSQADEQANLTQKLQPELMLTKVYLDAYARQTVNGLTTFPTAKRQIMNALERGLLFINYTGHGSPSAWTNEQVMTLPDIMRFTHKRLPVWITATCDFCNFDNPQTSGGEWAFLNETSGAIALYTTTRVVLDLDNKELNRRILTSLLGKDKEGNPHKLGNILRNAKNQRGGNDTINKLNFMLIGDPAVRLKMPTHRAVVSEINGINLDTQPEVVAHALERVSVKGSIQDVQGVVDGNFSGALYITIFNGEEERSTLPENIPRGMEDVTSYKDYLGIVYAGSATVENGFFSFDFIVPKDVTYSKARGKINLYAYAPEKKIEAMGVSHTFRVATGAPEEALEDTTPPVVELCYLNKPSEDNHFVVGATPLFVAKVFDESGINISGGGVGHDISLVIDDRFDLSYILNDYYSLSTTEAGKGDIMYMLPELEEGDHKATFTVWDVFNNVTKHTFTFRVHKDLTPLASATRVFPNPVAQGKPISFEFYTDTPGVELSAFVELFDFTGRRVAQSETIQLQTVLDTPIRFDWMPQTLYGTPLLGGHYLYRWTIKASNGKSSTSGGQLIIL